MADSRTFTTSSSARLAKRCSPVSAASRKQRHRRDRVGRWGGVVHQVLLADHELLGVIGRGEQPTVVEVPEVVEQGVGGLGRMFDPACLAGGLGESGERVDECRVRSLARAAWRALGEPSACHEREPAAVGASGARGRGHSPFATAAANQSARPNAAAASARVASIRPFHSVSTLSSRPGFGRRARAASTVSCSGRVLSASGRRTAPVPRAATKQSGSEKKPRTSDC